MSDSSSDSGGLGLSCSVSSVESDFSGLSEDGSDTDIIIQV